MSQTMTNQAVKKALPTTIFEEITPAKAREYLTKNTLNRPVEKKVVSQYATDMLDGNWHTSHQGIAFDESGALIDGQHRLMAIVKAGVTVKMAVTRGTLAITRLTCDSGRTRTVGQSLGFQGIANGTVVAGYINMLRIIITGINTTFSRAEIAQGYAELVHAFDWIAPHFAASSHVKKAMVGAPFVLAYLTDPIKATKALEQFISGENLSAGEPMFVARRYWLETRPRVAMSHVVRRQIATKILRCISAYIDGESLDAKRLFVSEVVVDRFSKPLAKSNGIFAAIASARIKG